jgi:REP element-mobilizing transposase RayT
MATNIANMREQARKYARLRGYDYAQPGTYFVTIVAYNRECLFGEIADGSFVPNTLGEIVRDEWLQTAQIRPETHLDEFVVMPNHFHGIVSIQSQPVGAHGRAPLPHAVGRQQPYRAPRSLGSLIAGFKAATTKRINAIRDLPGVPVWQRNYYDHIIREARELDSIRRYIRANPSKWDEDLENPKALLP